MSAAKIEERIAAAEAKLAKLREARKAAAAREKRRKTKQERANDTRRKVLLGAYMLKRMNEVEQVRDTMLAQLDKFLTRNSDRALFDLPPRLAGGENV
jgi:hypothetical protein